MIISDTSRLSNRTGFYLILVTLFSTILIISNLITIKLVAIPFFPWFLIPCGLLTYPLTYLISDLVTELYGEKQARFMVYLGFVMSLVTHFFVQIAVKLPAHADWVPSSSPYGYANSAEFEAAFATVFHLNGMALFSSMCAYVVAQILDIRLFSFLKELTKNKYLWIRTGGSTLISQIVDTLLVNVLFLYCALKLNLATVIYISILSYIYKGIITVCTVPLFYWGVSLAKRYLGPQDKTLKQLPHHQTLQELESAFSTE